MTLLLSSSLLCPSLFWRSESLAVFQAMAAEGWSHRKPEARSKSEEEEQERHENGSPMFSSDWKKIEGIDGTETSVQARRFSLWVQKNGLKAKVHNRTEGRGARPHPYPQKAPKNVIANLAEAYNFLGNMFDPDNRCSVEAHLQKLKEMDPITAESVLQMMKNLTINLSAPDFELLRRRLSMYDEKTQTVTHQGCSFNRDL